MDNNIWVKASAALAKRLHEDQVDKAGMDYFEGHLCMVALKELDGVKDIA